MNILGGNNKKTTEGVIDALSPHRNMVMCRENELQRSLAPGMSIYLKYYPLSLFISIKKFIMIDVIYIYAKFGFHKLLVNFDLKVKENRLC